jgi:diguanylate cyclase (GGDEF)-like protein
MVLDVRTMAILSAITPLMLGVVMTYYWRRRKVYGGFGRWVLANYGFSIGYALLSLRDTFPFFLSVILSNIIIMYGEILIFEGTQKFFGRPPFSLPNYLLLIAYTPLQIYFTYLQPDVNIRIALVSVVYTILIARTGFSLCQGTIPGLKKIARNTSYVFFIVALFSLSRGIHASLQSNQIALFSDELSAWYSVVFIAAILGWTFYFFILNSARLELDLETAHRELALIANTDSLTDLYNRRFFLTRAETELQRAGRYGYELSFLLVDIDDFKTINDRFGHAMGDQVIVLVAELLRSGVRNFDIVSRYGGDEFCIMLTNANQQKALVIAERLRAEIENTPITLNSHTQSLTISIGLSNYCSSDSELGSILQRADEALYLAKKQGRNLVKAT